MGGGSSEIVQNCATSFVDDPLRKQFKRLNFSWGFPENLLEIPIVYRTWRLLAGQVFEITALASDVSVVSDPNT